MRVRDASLFTSAGTRKELPRDRLPEIAFAGRSNVGKSSLLNALVGRRSLARTSRTPGRTQRINFFALDSRMLFVDLPGYGFARVPEAVRASWGPMVRSYLEEREPLRLIWVLVDSRHPPSEQDAQLVEWLRHAEVPFRVAMTKSDHLSGNGRPQALATCAEALELRGESAPLLTSAKTGVGIPQMWKEIDAHAARPKKPRVPDRGHASSPGDRGKQAVDPAWPDGTKKEGPTHGHS